MSNYKDLIKQREELDMQINAARAEEKAQAIKHVKAIVAEFELTEKQVFSKRKPYKKATAKYKDPVTGAKWTGRGREPLWIKGKNRSDFAI